MECIRLFSRLAAVALLLAGSPVSLFAQEARGGPADPTAKTLPVPHDAGAFATYLDPRLRGEGPDAIERSDFEQAKKIASETPVPQSPRRERDENPAAKPASPRAHGGHAGNDSSADGSRK